MRAAVSQRAAEQLAAAPANVARTFFKQLAYLLRDRSHPSLHAKKYDESRGLWQARINDDWRFYFTVEGDTYNITNANKHPK
jgi:plasmid maintenance system killer protein